jgi:hypothetical protein
MNTPSVPRRGPSRLKLFFWMIVVPAVLVALYFMVVLNWNYSSGERAGWVQKFSKKGWLCKTWEGELSMISMPGANPEKFYFTVWNDEVAAQINAAMGRRVSLHYDEKVGLPTTCFGETRHWVSGVTVVQEIPISPGVMVPVPPTNGAVPAPQPAAPAAPTPPPPALAPTSEPVPAPAPAQPPPTPAQPAPAITK